MITKDMTLCTYCGWTYVLAWRWTDRIFVNVPL